MRTKKLRMLAVVGAALSVSAVTAEDEPGDKALAWIRFEDAPEQYAGTSYLWLGDRRIELAVDVKPAAEHVLYLLWGSKNDARTAQAQSPQANPFGEIRRANENSTVNMHLCPEGKWAIGEDPWGKIVWVNMLKMKDADWDNVPGVKKAWRGQSRPLLRNRCLASTRATVFHA